MTSLPAGLVRFRYCPECDGRLRRRRDETVTCQRCEYDERTEDDR